MTDPMERGPGYDWKQEAVHYRDECDKLRDLLSKVEAQGERDAFEREALEQRLAEREAELADARKENYADDMNQAVETKLKYRERVKELEAEVAKLKSYFRAENHGEICEFKVLLTRERKVTQVLAAALIELANLEKTKNRIVKPGDAFVPVHVYASQALAEAARVREGSK